MNHIKLSKTSGKILLIVLFFAATASLSYAATHTSTTIWGYVENSATSMLVRVCGTGAVVQIRAENVTPGAYWVSSVYSYVENLANSCAPPSPYGWRLVTGGQPGDQVRIFSVVSDSALSEEAFMRLARRDYCTVTSLGNVSCSPILNYALEVYADKNYANTWCYSNSAGSANVASSCNDQISSLILQSGWSVRLYRDQNQSGPSRCLTTSDADLSNNTFDTGEAMDNKVSSFTLYNQTSCPIPPGVTPVPGVTPTPGPDITPPTGNVISPANGTTIGPGSVTFSADAWEYQPDPWYPEYVSGVDRVEFHVGYNGGWTHVGTDYSAPYQITWSIPSGLASQQLAFTIHVIDKAGNEKMDPGGYHLVNFVASHNTPSVNEYWVPANKRAYLNQRSLIDGWKKCGSTSAAMMLAMNNIIGADYSTMAAKANEMYPYTTDNYDIVWVYKIVDELRRQGATSNYHYLSSAAAWTPLKQEINAGRPVLVRTAPGVMTAAGHFFVAVGYQEVGTSHQVYAYDPYGEWRGFCCENNYNTNTTSSTSDKGKWVLYNFDRVFGDYIITVNNPASASIDIATTPDTPPDQVSDEPDIVGTYTGVPTYGELRVFIPVILK